MGSGDFAFVHRVQGLGKFVVLTVSNESGSDPGLRVNDQFFKPQVVLDENFDSCQHRKSIICSKPACDAELLAARKVSPIQPRRRNQR